MNKTLVFEKILAALEALRDNALSATQRAHDTATHEENVAENKYDTLGLEAAYLAHGQAQRLEECELDLQAYRNLVVKDCSETDGVAVGTLVELANEEDQRHWYFVGPGAGGLKIVFEGHTVMTITASAPLGRALMGKRVEDEVEVQVDDKRIYFDIIALY